MAERKVLLPTDAGFLRPAALTEVLVGVRVVGRQSHGSPQPLLHFLRTAALWGGRGGGFRGLAFATCLTST